MLFHSCRNNPRTLKPQEHPGMLTKCLGTPKPNSHIATLQFLRTIGNYAFIDYLNCFEKCLEIGVESKRIRNMCTIICNKIFV